MTIYILIIILLLFLVHWYDIKQVQTHKDFFQRVVLVILVLLVACSYHIGTDNQGYEDWFIYKLSPIYHFGINDLKWEPLFCVFCSLLKTISKDWLIARLVIVSIINFSLYRFARRYYNDCFFLTFLFYFIYYYYDINCEAIRQSLSMAIVLLAWPYFENGRLIKFELCALVATGFHYSGAIAMLIPLLRNVNFDIKSCGILVIITIIGASMNYYFSDFLRLLTIYSSGTLGRFEDNYGGIETSMLNINGMIMTFGIRIIPAIIAAFFLQYHKYFKTLMPGLWIFVLFMVLQIFVPPVFRVCNYYCIFMLGTISYAIVFKLGDSIKSNIFIKCKKVVSLYLVLSFLISSYLFYQNTNDFTGVTNLQRVVPYVSIFNPVNLPFRY